MSARHPIVAARPLEDSLRRGLVLIAALLTILGALHEGDHLLCGAQFSVPAFPLSFLIFPILLGGFVYASRGKLAAGCWLFVAIVGFVAAAPTHLGPAAVEPLPIVYGYYVAGAYNSPIMGAVAIVILLGLLGSVLLLAAVAIYARLRVGHW